MRPLRVLYVEDDPGHAMAPIEELRDDNIEVVSAEGVDQALVLIEESVFDAVVLDLIMPRGSLSEDETAGRTKTGLALARRMRRKRPSVPVVFLTAARDADTIEWCRRNKPAEYLQKGVGQYGELSSTIRQLQARAESEALNFIDLVASRFGHVVARLEKRYNQRPVMDIADEYDVQDLLTAMLTLKFDDVRREEPTPSFAGGASRGDFLLKAEGVFIEVKRPRDGQPVRDIGVQLIEDVARYRSHPDCHSLFFFIYDPDGRIVNPKGLGTDIERLSTPELRVVVAINGRLGYYSGASADGRSRKL